MSTEKAWVYRVEEPHGSEGWRPYGGDAERRRGTIITDDQAHGAKYVAALVVTDLVTEWDLRGTSKPRHVRVLVWHETEGTPEDAAFTVEVQPEIHTE
ncbi:hypothetical protein ABZ922_31330 [Streptomyces shenzhenensis]|uniref:hypothetical protein n=1 Tax=Streptomyces shenzhenensis TaxID=943815 RepID=UPI0033FA24F9